VAATEEVLALAPIAIMVVTAVIIIITTVATTQGIQNQEPA